MYLKTYLCDGDFLLFSSLNLIFSISLCSEILVFSKFFFHSYLPHVNKLYPQAWSHHLYPFSNGPNETLLAFGILKQECHKAIIFSLKKIYKRNHMEKLLKHLQNSQNIYTQQCFIKFPKGTETENWPRYDCDLGTQWSPRCQQLPGLGPILHFKM